MFKFFNNVKLFQKIISQSTVKAFHSMKNNNNEPMKRISFKKMFLFGALLTAGVYYYVDTHDDTHLLNFHMSRTLSMIAGYTARMEIPVFMREWLYTKFASLYNVHLDEIEEPLTSYNTFLHFFTRKIKPRIIDMTPNAIVSPADCKVLCFSEVTGNECLIVKGINYRLGELIMGDKNFKFEGKNMELIKKNDQNKVFQCILYLAPGDYHRFHSPIDFHVSKRIHIHGRLKPVLESYVKSREGVYEKNERVTLLGEYPNGKFCMVFVGALNVGSIELNFDPALKTNSILSSPYDPYITKDYSLESVEVDKKNIQLLKGQELGRFNLGSTIVLLFEADPNFKWNIKAGDTLRYGQIIGSMQMRENCELAIGRLSKQE